MQLLYIFIGLLIGIIISVLYFKFNIKTVGYIDVDIQSNLCKVHISTDDLSNNKTKKAIFRVNHEVKVVDIYSREEQTL